MAVGLKQARDKQKADVDFVYGEVFAPTAVQFLVFICWQRYDL